MRRRTGPPSDPDAIIAAVEEATAALTAAVAVLRPALAAIGAATTIPPVPANIAAAIDEIVARYHPQEIDVRV